MTDFPTSLSDEELSAILDGEAGPQIADRLSGDPAAQARLQELTAARDLIRTPVEPLDAATVDQLVAGAIAAGGAPATHAGGGALDDQVVAPLAPRSTRRAPTQFLVAAAVVAMVAVGLALVWSGTRVSDEPTETATELPDTADPNGARDRGTSNDDAGGSAEAEPAEVPDDAPDGHGAVPSTIPADEAEEAAELVDLGHFRSENDLRNELRAAFPPGAGTVPDDEAPSVASVDRCTEQARTILGDEVDGEPTGQGLAVLDARDTLVFEFAATSVTGEPTTLVSVVDLQTCDLVLNFYRN